jgi:tetratricopeptide (TPR) repeat protein
MNINLQLAMQDFISAQSLDSKEVSSFAPADFRHGVQWLVAQNQNDLAQALAEAGLSLYPGSEDILAISSLLAMTREDWPLAVELLEDLIEVQKDQTQPMTYQMLARSLACNLDLAQAHAVLDHALSIWPEDQVLQEEKDTLVLSAAVISADSKTH